MQGVHQPAHEDEAERVVALAEIISGLHSKWVPHEGQIPIGRALFYEGAKQIFVCAGRNFGKSQFAAYAAWRWAMENPGSSIFIFEPYNTQAREILWQSNVIQSLGPSEWVESVNHTEMRVTFKNGSWIRVSGSDNYEAFRGVKPNGLIVFDEYKDLRPEFLEAFLPNLAAFEPPMIAIGTPPHVENHFTEAMEIAKNSKQWRFFHAPTSANPYISKTWLANKEAEMKAAGNEEVFMREYLAVFVKGGKGSIFPQVAKHPFLPREQLIPKDLNHWNMLVSADPGSASVFAVLFILWNPYQRQAIIVDEIYETNMEKMRVRPIADRIDEKLEPFRSCREIEFIYDNAAKWMANEMAEARPKWWWMPCDKTENGREDGISLTRELLHFGNLHIAAECEKLRWEMESYIRDDNGKIPKINDHGIDCLFYGLKHIGPSIDESSPPKEKPLEEQPRAYRLEDDFKFSSEIGDEVGVSPYTGESL